MKLWLLILFIVASTGTLAQTDTTQVHPDTIKQLELTKSHVEKMKVLTKIGKRHIRRDKIFHKRKNIIT